MGQNFTSVRNQLENLNLVESSLSLGGKPIPFASLTLEQKFNAHHVMQVRVNYEALSKVFMEKPEDVINLIGEKISLSMKHRITGSYNLFFGLVTNAVIEGSLGTDNNILITAKSTSIRLDGKKSMDSFYDCPLEAVVNEALGNSGNNEDMIIKPTFKEYIDYICQYNETDFEFFNRLSYIYGEWFWNDGTMTHFGRELSADKGVTLTYDVDMHDFRLEANLTPARFNRYNYLIHKDNEIQETAPDKVPGQRGYLDIAVGKSDLTFQAEGDLPCEAPVLSNKELEDLVRIERSRAVGEMLTVTGTSRTCEVKIGKPVTLRMPYENLPLKEVEEFLVTGVTHYIDELGHYSNYFTGIINGLEAIPMAPVAPPLAYQQQAEVMDNADPENKGRVRVQLQWQKNRGKCTNWIRVATPDAGSSGKVSTNRGLVTIPEVGDQVMIGFEYGDPNRPYVMSSIFTETAGAGGGANNDSKTLTDKTGSALQLAAGAATLIDQTGGNKLSFDGNDTANLTANDHIVITNGKCTIEILGAKIKISAPEEITFESKNIGILASDTLDIRGKNGETKNITVKGGETMNVKVKNNLTVNAKTTNMSSEESLDVSANTSMKVGSKSISITGQDTVVVDGQEVKINS